MVGEVRTGVLLVECFSIKSGDHSRGHILQISNSFLQVETAGAERGREGRRDSEHRFTGGTPC
jgi:hypothetical protein